MTDILEMEEPQVACVVPLVDADRMDCQQTTRVVEPEVLRKPQVIPGMNELRLAGGAKIQSKIWKRFAIVVNMLLLASCDVLYVHRQRHRQAVRTLTCCWRCVVHHRCSKRGPTVSSSSNGWCSDWAPWWGQVT